MTHDCMLIFDCLSISPEYAGFDFDIRNLFPNEETRHTFLRNYVAEATGCGSEDVSPQFLKGLDVSGS